MQPQGITAQFPPNGSSTAPAAAARHLRCLLYTSANKAVKAEIGTVFSHVLENAGVFKQDAQGQAAFVRFMQSLSLIHIWQCCKVRIQQHQLRHLAGGLCTGRHGDAAVGIF